MLGNRELRKKRTLTYFIEAAQKIIREEGIDAITIRKVASIAGYNSSTLYNYFKDLDHLILFASLKYLKLYNLEVVKEIKKYKSERKKFISMWEVFCNVSFAYPQPFKEIFFNKHSESLDVITKRYFELFPEDIGTIDKNLKEILIDTKLGERNKISLQYVAAEENKTWENLDLMNEMMIALYHDLLLQRIGDDSEDSQQYYEDKMMEYIYLILSLEN